MDVARARYLASPRGRDALASVPADIAELSPLPLVEALRRSLPPHEAAAIAEQISLRSRAASRLPGATPFLLSADGLEMMTHPAVATRRATRLATLELPVADLTAGLGGDLTACIAAGIPAIGLERDEATAILSAANTAGRVARADALHAPAETSRVAVVVDPSRRGPRGRRFDPAAFSPPWDAAIEIAGSAVAAVIKGPPGIDHQAVPSDCELEFVQFGRSLREAAAWFGCGTTPGLRRAVLLPSGAEISSAEPEAPGSPAPIGTFVIDPESCVTRAGLVRQLASRIDARLVDPQVAYLTSETPAATPLAATFDVLDVLAFSVGRLKSYLREHAWRPEEIRRRAFPVEPDELRRLLGRLEGDPVTLLCTTIEGQRTVIIGRRIHSSENCEAV